MRIAPFVAVTLLAATAPAMAASVLSDGFEGDGPPALNFTAFDNFSVTRGSVDLLGDGDFGLNCFAGDRCVDLGGSGSGNNGRLTSRASYSFAAGDTVTLSFQLSGNQRPSSDDFDNFGAGFVFSSGTSLSSFGYNYFGTAINLGSNFTAGFSVGSGVFAEDPYARRSIFFTAGDAGSLTFNIFSNDDDSFGPLLDNVDLDVTAAPPPPAVPEPATWMTMMVGFGLAGAALRRRLRAPARV